MGEEPVHLRYLTVLDHLREDRLEGESSEPNVELERSLIFNNGSILLSSLHSEVIDGDFSLVSVKG